MAHAASDIVWCTDKHKRTWAGWQETALDPIVPSVADKDGDRGWSPTKDFSRTNDNAFRRPDLTQRRAGAANERCRGRKG